MSQTRGWVTYFTFFAFPLIRAQFSSFFPAGSGSSVISAFMPGP